MEKAIAFGNYTIIGTKCSFKSHRVALWLGVRFIVVDDVFGASTTGDH